jgi:threonine dehydrogenase-like Zn-dependent dehydrogenase
VVEIPHVMRAAVLFGPNDLRVVEKPVPRPAYDEVLVRVAMCGACGTDVAIQTDPFPGQPPFGSFTPGHEWTGTVVDRGAGVDEVDIGQRVAIHVHHGCGRCRNCLTGSYTACENYGDYEKGHSATGFTRDGGFAEYVVHNVSCVYPLPDNLSWEESVLVSTAGTSVYGLDRASGLIAGDTVVVIGPGPVGIMTAQTARALGATTVIVVGTRQERLDLASALGVTEVRRLTRGRGADMVIESSGDPATPNQGLEMLRRGGKLLILAFYKDPVSFNLGFANREEISIVTSRGEGRQAVGRALQLAAAGLISGERLVTHRFPLDEIQAGFDMLRSRQGKPMKVVFIP